MLSVLAAAGGDLAAAEDALADALETALLRWPSTGVPENPPAWVLTVARNRLRDVLRSAAHRRNVPLGAEIVTVATELVDLPEPDQIPDRRLELLLVCAHPAIAPAARTPLMLQAVLGVDAAAIAGAFAVQPAAMAQRLVRAKRRIKTARIPFVMPERAQLTERLPAVLEAVYGAYAIDWQLEPEGRSIESLSAEALHLALLLSELLPDEPEVLGLAALVSLSESRRSARRAADGCFIPLPEQDAARWDTGLIDQGERLLGRAHGYRKPGRFQYEAAIQSAHCSRLSGAGADPATVRTLYRALIRVAPSLGAQVALAGLDADIDGPEAGLRALDRIGTAEIGSFQPAWALRAHLLATMGKLGRAAAAYRRAIELTPDAGVAEYLRRQLRGIGAMRTS
ncbi:MAG: RNA polymerase subunit sigma-70 [Mycobacterium sp.]|nr:RNA polymerase subunit sigma-70 [Mycobacterium sp.]